MKTCPACGHSVKDSHERCMKCGAQVPGEPPAAPPDAVEGGLGARARARASVLGELLPKRERVNDLLPHPAGWILGIGLPAILVLMIVHAITLPDDDQARQDAARAATGPDVASESRLQRCLAQARAKADLECGGITGRGAAVRRMTCTAARLSSDYARCTGHLTGRVASCLGRCGQEARGCSSACAITGGVDQDWTDTARCLLPCWADHLRGCASRCFRTGGGEPDPQASPSAI